MSILSSRLERWLLKYFILFESNILTFSYRSSLSLPLRWKQAQTHPTSVSSTHLPTFLSLSSASNSLPLEVPLFHSLTYLPLSLFSFKLPPSRSSTVPLTHLPTSLSLQLQTPSLSKFLQSLMIGIPIWCIGQVSFSLHFETQNWTEGNGGIGQGQILQSFSARLKQRISTYFVRITVQLTYYFDWFGFSNFITLPSLAVLLVGWIKTSQTGGQLKSDISLLEVV